MGRVLTLIDAQPLDRELASVAGKFLTGGGPKGTNLEMMQRHRQQTQFVEKLSGAGRRRSPHPNLSCKSSVNLYPRGSSTSMSCANACSLRCAAVEGWRPGALIDCCLLQIAEHVGASLRHARIDGFTAWHHRPAALLDEGGLLPRTGFFQLRQVGGSIRAVLELIDADRSDRCDHGAMGGSKR